MLLKKGMPNKPRIGYFLKITLLSFGTWYTDKQHPKYQRLFSSRIDETFARFSVGGQTGEAGPLIALGCLFVLIETIIQNNLL